jgi:monothiol glutaredoxin
MEKKDILAQIDREVKSHEIVMYVKGSKNSPQCGFSHATIELFKKIGRPFETVDVLADPERRRFVPEYTQWPTFPQVFIDGKFIGGCDIVHEMDERGELAPLVEKAFSGSSSGKGPA